MALDLPIGDRVVVPDLENQGRGQMNGVQCPHGSRSDERFRPGEHMRIQLQQGPVGSIRPQSYERSLALAPGEPFTGIVTLHRARASIKRKGLWEMSGRTRRAGARNG